MARRKGHRQTRKSRDKSRIQHFHLTLLTFSINLRLYSLPITPKMQLSGNTIGAYKRKGGHRSRLQNRKEDGQPFLILPNLNKKLKFSKRSLATALIMAIKIGVFIGALAVLFSLVKGSIFNKNYLLKFNIKIIKVIHNRITM